MSDTRFTFISADGTLERLPSLTAALEAAKRPGFVWLDYADPTHQELSALVPALGVHPLSIEDCFDQDQIPKIDVLPTNTFILFNSYRYAGGELSVAELDFFLGKNFLVSVHKTEAGKRLLGTKLTDAIDVDLANVKKGPDFLLHVILDQIVDLKFETLEMIQEELDAIEEAILEDPVHFRPSGLLGLRRALLQLRKSLFHEREILIKICRRDSQLISEAAIYHYRDIYDHLSRFFELCELCRELISNHMETYLSLMNNRMTLLAHQTNSVMRRLTFITTVFMPLTLIAGIGGMSEWSMMTGPQNWKVTYPLFLLLMAVIGGLNYWVLRWVDRTRTPDGIHPADPAG